MSPVFPRQLLPESSQLLEGAVCPAGAENGFCSWGLRLLTSVCQVEVQSNECVLIFPLSMGVKRDMLWRASKLARSVKRFAKPQDLSSVLGSACCTKERTPILQVVI